MKKKKQQQKWKRITNMVEKKWKKLIKSTNEKRRKKFMKDINEKNGNKWKPALKKCQ